MKMRRATKAPQRGDVGVEEVSRDLPTSSAHTQIGLVTKREYLNHGAVS
jgi:hypothetical protein